MKLIYVEPGTPGALTVVTGVRYNAQGSLVVEHRGIAVDASAEVACDPCPNCGHAGNHHHGGSSDKAFAACNVPGCACPASNG